MDPRRRNVYPRGRLADRLQILLCLAKLLLCLATLLMCLATVKFWTLIFISKRDVVRKMFLSLSYLNLSILEGTLLLKRCYFNFLSRLELTTLVALTSCMGYYTAVPPRRNVELYLSLPSRMQGRCLRL